MGPGCRLYTVQKTRDTRELPQYHRLPLFVRAAGLHGVCLAVELLQGLMKVAYTVGLSEKPPAADMIIRLGRLTPGYFRLLQRQVSGEVQMQPQNNLVNPIAMTMATVGIGVSFYSARQMAERVHLKQPAA